MHKLWWMGILTLVLSGCMTEEVTKAWKKRQEEYAAEQRRADAITKEHNTKTIKSKQQSITSSSDIDDAALFFGGKFRSITTVKTNFLLVSTDGCTVRVSEEKSATVEIGDKFFSEHWRCQSE